MTRLPWTLLPAVLLAGLALAQQQAPPADEPQTDQVATAEDDVPFLDELPAEAPKEPVPAAAPAEGQAEPQQAEEQEEKLVMEVLVQKQQMVLKSNKHRHQIHTEDLRVCLAVVTHQVQLVFTALIEKQTVVQVLKIFLNLGIYQLFPDWV